MVAYTVPIVKWCSLSNQVHQGWASLFRSILDEVSVRSAASALGRGDLRETVRSYARAERLPKSASRAFAIGEALRPRVSWCSGVVALYAAGFYGDVVRVVANLALYPGTFDFAVTIAVAAPLVLDEGALIGTHFTRVEPVVDRKEVAREFLSRAAGDAVTLAWARSRESVRGWDAELDGIAALAAAKTSQHQLEPYVRSALLRWGALHANEEVRGLLMPLAIGRVVADWTALMDYASVREDFVQSLLRNTRGHES